MMIDKLYNLKKTQTEQKLMEKGQIISKLNHIDDEILFTENKIKTATVQRYGAISDFSILAIHKNTMKLHIKKLEAQKISLNKQLEDIMQQIVQLQKECEQYGYILEEQKQENLKRLLVGEEEASSEYIQSKYISG